jgi:hypothetical protein
MKLSPFVRRRVGPPRPPLGVVPEWQGHIRPPRRPRECTNGLSGEYQRPDIFRTSGGLQKDKRPVVCVLGSVTHTCVQNHLCPVF